MPIVSLIHHDPDLTISQECHLKKQKSEDSKVPKLEGDVTPTTKELLNPTMKVERVQ